MTAVNVGPFAVTVASTVTLQPPQKSAIYYDRVVIANASPFLGTVQFGVDQSWLQPFMEDLFDIPTSGVNPQVTMQQAPGGPSSVASGQPSYITGTFLAPGDEVSEDAYPASMTAAAIASAVSASFAPVPLATVAGSSASHTVTLPASTQSLRVLVPGATTATLLVDLSVTGVATNQSYGPVLVPATDTAIVALDDAFDTQVTVAFVSAPGLTWYIEATPAPLVLGTYGYEVNQTGAPAVFGYAQVAGVSNDGKTRGLDLDTSGRIVLPVTQNSAAAELTFSASPPVSATVSGSSGVLLRGLTVKVGATAVTSAARVEVIDNGAGGGVLADFTVDAVSQFALPVALPPGGYQLIGSLVVEQATGNIAGHASIAGMW